MGIRPDGILRRGPKHDWLVGCLLGTHEIWLPFSPLLFIADCLMKTELTNSFDKVFLIIEFDAANQWIYNNWLGVLPTGKVIEGCQATIDFLKHTPCPHMLNDNRQVVGSWNSANDWIAANWVPQVLTLGLRRFAHIVSPGIFGQASAEEMVTRVGTQLEIRLFKDVDLAQAWLRAK